MLQSMLPMLFPEPMVQSAVPGIFVVPEDSSQKDGDISSKFTEGDLELMEHLIKLRGSISL